MMMIITTSDIVDATLYCARKINNSEWKPDVVIGVLRGCVYFYSSLTLHLEFPFQMDFITLGRYNETLVVKNVPPDLYKKKVLVVEGIVDTGNTIRAIYDDFTRTRRCESVKFVSLLKRKTAKIGKCELIYGQEIDEGWVFGYGMDDIDGYKRNLTEIIIKDVNI